MMRFVKSFEESIERNEMNARFQCHHYLAEELQANSAENHLGHRNFVERLEESVI